MMLKFTAIGVISVPQKPDSIPNADITIGAPCRPRDRDEDEWIVARDRARHDLGHSLADTRHEEQGASRSGSDSFSVA